MDKISALRLFLFCFSFINAVHSFFDLDELKSINYGIDIRNDPVVMKAEDDATDLNTVQLTSKYGQLYQCNFPNTAEQEKEKEEAEKVAVETGIPDLLKPMESSPCLKMNNGWWSYEFCYGRHIHQFHLNEESRVDGEVLSLGIYESEFNWDEDLGQSDFDKRQSRLRRYHTQQYVNGTKCDLNGNLRKTEVRFICEEGSGDYINRIDEPETCAYIMTVHTTKICHHPFLKPPTPTKTVSITCHPLLTVIQYQEYLDEIEEESERKRQQQVKQKEKEEELQRIAKEKEKYFKKSQDIPDKTGDSVEVDPDQLGIDTDSAGDSTNFLKDMMNAAKQLKPGDSPVEMKAMFQVINDPSDVDEFIKKAVKEMERAEKAAQKKKEGLDIEESPLERSLPDEEDIETEETEIDTDNMQRFDGNADDEDVSQEHLQTVDNVNKMKSGGHKRLSKLSRKQRDTLRRGTRSHAKIGAIGFRDFADVNADAPRNQSCELCTLPFKETDVSNNVNKMKSGGHKRLSKLSRKQRDTLRRVQRGVEEEDQDEDEILSKGEKEEEEDKVVENKGKRQNLFEDVEKHMKTLAEKQKQYRDRTLKDDTKGEFRDSSDLSDLMDEVDEQLKSMMDTQKDLMDEVDEQLKSMMDTQKEMKDIGKDIHELLENDLEDEEIKSIKSKYLDKRSKLVDIKQRLRDLMEKQYESIVKEAEEELGMEDEVDKPTATQELAKTLDGLLAKMDKTEQEINAVDKELEQFAEFDNEETEVKSVPPVRDDLQQAKGPDGAMDNDRVQVRVSRIKPGQKFTSTSDKQTQELEKSVKEELAKAGFANGDKIQVKIITSYYDGDDDSVHTLSEKDSEAFKNLIVNLIGGTSEGDKAIAQHQEQEDNYSFVFGKHKQAAQQTHTDTYTDTHTDTDIQMEDDGS